MISLAETLVSDLSKRVFFREFSFPDSHFTGAGAGELNEFADHVVWIDELLIIYQVKERSDVSGRTPDTERKWFDRGVLHDATKQVRDTLAYLSAGSVEVSNHRGHQFNLDIGKVTTVLKLVLYEPSNDLPADRKEIKHHLSKTAGFIHVLQMKDYRDVCEILVTPAEVCQYLDFREQLVTKWENMSLPSERALLGQFVSGSASAKPSAQFESAPDSISELDFDMWFVFDGIADRIENASSMESATDYYRIIAEFAKLNRLELAEFKKRFQLCLEAVNDNRFKGPTRIISPQTGCGFVFLTVVDEFVAQRIVGLENMTELAKYDQRLDKCVGVSIAKEGSDYLVGWCFVGFSWEEDLELDEALAKGNPFLPLKNVVRDRYA